MASLKDFSGGAERFKIGLTLVFCTAAIKGLLLKFLNGGLSNGPITYSFLIQLATVSVIHLPYLKADLALGELYEGEIFFLNCVLLPILSTFRLLKAIFVCLADHLCLQLEMKLLNSSTLTFVEGDVFEIFFGKLFQKECGWGMSYLSNSVISGHFNEKEGSGRGWAANIGCEWSSQVLIFDQE